MHFLKSSFTAVFSSRSKKKNKVTKDQNQAPDAAVATTNHEITRSLTAYPTPTAIPYLSRPAPITIFSNPKPLGQFTYQNQQTQVPVIAIQQPGFKHRLPGPLPGTIDYLHPKPTSNSSNPNTQGPSFRYQDESPAPVVPVVKKPYSNRASPYATSAAISCSLRPKPLSHPRYGLSQSLVAKSAGFGSAGSVVVCGDREDQPTSYLQAALNAEESEDEETEPVIEPDQDNRPLPLPVLESWAEGCLDMAVSPYRQGPTNQEERPKSWDDQLDPPSPSDWVPTVPTAPTVPTKVEPLKWKPDHTVPTKMEPLKWKPDHTAAGYLRAEQLDLRFEKLASVSFESVPPASLIAEHFCHSGNSSQGQQSPATWSNYQQNSPPICMIFPTVFENDPDDLKPFSEDLSSARARLQQADAQRNFAGARDLWRHHANMMGVEPEISIMNASSLPVRYRRARVPQGPTVLRRPGLPVQVPVQVPVSPAAEFSSGFGVGESLRRSAPIPIPIPIRRRARGLAYPPPLPTIPASPSTSPRDTPLSSKNIPAGARVMPGAVQSEHNLKNRFKRSREFKTAIRNVFRAPQRA